MNVHAGGEPGPPKTLLSIAKMNVNQFMEHV